MNWPDFLSGRPLPLVMGILNVTPDSFSDGGRFFAPDRAKERGLELAGEGADLIDVGGESTRPANYGRAAVIAPEEEIRRTAPVIEGLQGRVGVPLSIDTRKGPVARAALRAGAEIVNDVTALRFDPEMAAILVEAGASAILMHMRGTDPVTMQEGLSPGDPFPAVVRDLEDALRRAQNAGLADDRIALDPGLGFGKTPEQNLALLSRLSRLRPLGRPLVAGPSRKGFVGRFSGVPGASAAVDRLSGSLACVAMAAEEGAAVVRVHDVAATVRFLAAGRCTGDWEAAAAAAGAPPEPFERMLRALRDSAASYR